MSTASKEGSKAKDTHRRVLRAMAHAPTDSCSRHVRIMGHCLMRGKPYPMLTEEPEHCAQSLLVTVEMLYKARREIASLKAKLSATPPANEQDRG
jgi:hypothetical protein